MIDCEFSRPRPLDKIDRKKGLNERIEATADECVALAERFALISLESLNAAITVLPKSDDVTYHVKGVLTAGIIQKSVISGQGVAEQITADIDAWYIDQSKVASFDRAKKKKDRQEEDDYEYEIQNEQDDPEPLFNGILDIGEVAAEFLGLALDDYPRLHEEGEGAGDYIEIKPEDSKPKPFAKLAELTKPKQ